MAASENSLNATVVALQANFYRVRLECPQAGIPHGARLLCTCRGRLRKIGQSVVVGDRVEVADLEPQQRRGTIAAVGPRQTQLTRPPLANADRLLAVMALAEPPPDPLQLSRFLVAAEASGLTPLVGLNKSDRVSAGERERWCQRLRAWGYDAIPTSATWSWGLDALERCLQGHLTAVAGPSGAGKSSTIDGLVPHAQLRVGAISRKTRRGRQTTRHVELFELPQGGLLADTPGFKRPQLDCEPQALAQYFPEARARLAVGACQFADCLHQAEPQCAVRGDWERYRHYLQLLEEARARAQARQQQRDREASTKVKTRRDGRLEREPKLDPRKYRRPSRRRQNQTLQGLLDEAEAE